MGTRASTAPAPLVATAPEVGVNALLRLLTEDHGLEVHGAFDPTGRCEEVGRGKDDHRVLPRPLVVVRIRRPVGAARRASPR